MKSLLLALCIGPMALLAQTPDSVVWVHDLQLQSNTVEIGNQLGFSFQVSQTDSFIHEIPLWDCLISVSISVDGQPGAVDSVVATFDYPPFSGTNTETLSGAFGVPLSLPAGNYFLMVSSQLSNCGADPSFNTYAVAPFAVLPFANGPCPGTPLVLGAIQCSAYLPDGSLQLVTIKDGTYRQYTIDTTAQVVENIWYNAPYEITVDLHHDTLVRHEVYRPTVFETRILPPSLYGAYHSFKDVIEFDGGYVFTAFKNAPFYPAPSAPNTAELELTLIKTDAQFNVLATQTYYTQSEGWPSLTVMDTAYFAFGYGRSGSLPSAFLLVMNANLGEYSNLKTYEDSSYPISGYGPSTALNKNICGQHSYTGGNKSGHSPFGVYSSTYTVTVQLDSPDFQLVKNKRNGYSYGSGFSGWSHSNSVVSPTGGELLVEADYHEQTGSISEQRRTAAHVAGDDTLFLQPQFFTTVHDELVQLGSHYFILRPLQGDSMVLIPADCSQFVPVHAYTPPLAATQLRIFPNPATDQCWVMGLERPCQLRLFNAVGVLVYQSDAIPNNPPQPLLLQLPGLTPGAYWLQAIEQGQPPRVAKVVIAGK